jgi:hypothetical protein
MRCEVIAVWSYIWRQIWQSQIDQTDVLYRGG